MSENFHVGKFNSNFVHNADRHCEFNRYSESIVKIHSIPDGEVLVIEKTCTTCLGKTEIRLDPLQRYIQNSVRV